MEFAIFEFEKIIIRKIVPILRKAHILTQLEQLKLLKRSTFQTYSL